MHFLKCLESRGISSYECSPRVNDKEEFIKRNVKFQPICGHWGLTLMASLQITPQKIDLAHLAFEIFIIVPLLAQEQSNLGPKEA